MRVLNAFRHQRFDTFVLKDFFFVVIECSTPFGIRDSTRSRLEKLFLIESVLNAFRHQRFDTNRSLQSFCPFLTVLNAFRHQRFDTAVELVINTRKFGAQRLSASEIRHNKPVQNKSVILFFVLNAFRHQRFDTGKEASESGE